MEEQIDDPIDAVVREEQEVEVEKREEKEESYYD